MKTINNILLAAAAAFSIAALTGCVDDRYDGPQTGDGELAISFVADDLVPGELKTRAGGTRVAKDNEELEIKSLHVFIFGSDGNYIQPSDGHRWQGYTYLDGSSMLRIDKQGFLDESLARNATVCVVANVENGTFNVGDGDYPVEIQNLQDFENYTYLPENYQGLLFDLPDGMPMVKIERNVDLVSRQGTVDIEMEALMARIDVNLSIDSDASDTELPSILIKSVSMMNMAQGAKFVAPESGAETPAEITLKNNESVQTGVTTMIYNRQEGKEFSFYVFENIRDDNGKSDSEVYPTTDTDGTPFKEEYKQRYKPLFAKPEATYARFDCLFTSYNGLTYNVTYDLYFGSNSTKDFRIRRNSIYTNDVTIKGLVNVGESPDKAIFDYRVNVEPQENAYFISTLRERQLDAHFNVFPMDVYVMQPGCHVKIEVVDPQNANWIRMERIPAANMAAGTVPAGMSGIAYAAGSAYKAGNGKRHYFTTDLVTNTLSANTSFDMQHRDRVYFYVDEFLSTREEPRKALIRISLIDDATGEVRESHDAEFDQYGLLPVTVRSGNDRYPGDGAVIYMERFEEYLNFSDPLDDYSSTMVYDGLPWGADGDDIGRGPASIALSRCFNNYYHGRVFTEMIVEVAGDAPTLNVAPTTAAGYCWNKNKRSNQNGGVNDGDNHWFLPGITQMESCLVRYQADFPEFRGNFYWSSASAKKRGWLGVGESEETSRARATKVIGFNDDGTADYAESGSTNGDDNFTGMDGTKGRALRTESLRIRACYVGPVDQ